MSMPDKPFKIAMEMYRGKGWSFLEELVLYASEHYLLATPKHLILARDTGDAWFIQLAIGKGFLEEWFKYMPHKRPWIGWAREFRTNPKDVRYHKLSTLMRRLCKKKRSSSGHSKNS